MILLISVAGMITESIHRQRTFPPVSKADELRKYKELFDDGVITEQEFIAKKDQILRQ